MQNVQKVRLGITGDRALMMHNIRLANPLDDIAKRLKVLSAKRKKTDDDLASLARLEFEGGLYMNDLGPYVPSEWLEGALHEAAKAARQGKNLQRAVIFDDAMLSLLYKGPRDVAGLWDAGFYDQRMVRVGAARVLRCRPRFQEWATETVLSLDTGLVNPDDFAQIMERAQMVGVGDYRPRFGRFHAELEWL